MFPVGALRRRVAPQGRRSRARARQPARALAVGDDGHRQQHRDDHAGHVLAVQPHDARRRGRRIDRPLDRPRRRDLRRQFRRPAGQPAGRDRRRQRDQHGAGGRDSQRISRARCRSAIIRDGKRAAEAGSASTSSRCCNRRRIARGASRRRHDRRVRRPRPGRVSQSGDVADHARRDATCSCASRRSSRSSTSS